MPKLVLVDILSNLKEENKKLGKLFKNKKNNIVICPNFPKEENVIEVSEKRRSTRLEIYQQMKTLIDLENDHCTNAQDTDIQNIVGVRPNDGVGVITISSKDFKCTQCPYRKPTHGVVETHMYEMHGIGGF